MGCNRCSLTEASRGVRRMLVGWAEAAWRGPSDGTVHLRWGMDKSTGARAPQHADTSPELGYTRVWGCEKYLDMSSHSAHTRLAGEGKRW
jgi:hypothetical protein